MVMAYDFRAFSQLCGDKPNYPQKLSGSSVLMTLSCPPAAPHSFSSCPVLPVTLLTCCPLILGSSGPVWPAPEKLPFSLIYYTDHVDGTEGIVTCQCFHSETVLVSCGCWGKKRCPKIPEMYFHTVLEGKNLKSITQRQKQDVGRVILLLEALGKNPLLTRWLLVASDIP